VVVAPFGLDCLAGTGKTLSLLVSNMRQSDVADQKRIIGVRSELLTAQQSADAAWQEVTVRAQAFITAGTLTIADVLDVLRISRATWYRRLEALRHWEASRSETIGDPE
jgi:hypothetical protein